MSVNKVHFIINPKSAGGSTGRRQEGLLTAIQKIPAEVSYSFTDRPGAGHSQAIEALREQPDVIAVAGGDGTVSEVVSGLIESGNSENTSIAVINRGTGGDFCRSLGVPSDLSMALEQITEGRDLAVDAGRISYLTKSGGQESRYFINVAGCGMAGEVVEAINKSSKRFGGLSYFLTSSQVLWRYRNHSVRIALDDQEPFEQRIVTVAIANGQFFGGGMQIAPEAQLGDGLLDVVILGNWNKLQSLWYSRNLYNGSISSANKVQIAQARKVRIEPLDPDDKILIDCDGEDVGYAPIEVEIIPRAIRFRI